MATACSKYAQLVGPEGERNCHVLNDLLFSFLKYAPCLGHHDMNWMLGYSSTGINAYSFWQELRKLHFWAIFVERWRRNNSKDVEPLGRIYRATFTLLIKMCTSSSACILYDLWTISKLNIMIVLMKIIPENFVFY